jgi:hypothetical protein
MRSCGIIAGLGAALVLSACGSGAEQNATEPLGKFRVAISTASFPHSQKLAQHSHLVIAVRNSGTKTIAHLAVTICNVTCAYPAPKGEGTAAQAFAAAINQPYLASSSRPMWIVDQAPGPCQYSCQNGGQGGGVTAYSNTWALGPLRPGRTIRFDWKVTAVQPGKHVVAWQVAAGLNGRAKAVLADGTQPHGTFVVDVSSKPEQAYVNNSGKIVFSSGQ